MNKDLRINEEIRAKDVRLISAEGEQLGVVAFREAMRLAGEQQVDLVEISPNAKPPVCKLMDFGKYMFEQAKREKEVKKKQKLVSVKEVKLRPGIEDHDFNVKYKNVDRFLADGDKVKVTIMFRGRELSHPELGKQVLDKIAAQVGPNVHIEREAKLEGKNMIMILAPKS